MGFSRAFGCFKDPEARAQRKQKKTGKRTRNEGARPNRIVVAASARGGQAEVEMRILPGQSPLPATVAVQNSHLPASISESDELEPWSVGAVIRRTSQIQARLAEAAKEKKRAEEKVDVPNSEARYQATVEDEVEMPTIETRPQVITKERESKETRAGEATSTPNLTSDKDGGGGGSGVRATMMFGVPTTKKEPDVDLRAIEEEAEIRQFTEENNALAAKGSHSAKYSGAVGWNPAYSQKATPVPLQGKNTRNSGWGWPGLTGPYGGPAVDEPYYDYGLGAANGSPRSPVGSNPYSAGYGYGRRGSSHYSYVSGPAN